jgi:alpha-L-fucosidase
LQEHVINVKVLMGALRLQRRYFCQALMLQGGALAAEPYGRMLSRVGLRPHSEREYGLAGNGTVSHPIPIGEFQGGGDLNPGLQTDPAAIRRFMDLRIGLSVHWGPCSQTGLELSWSRGHHSIVSGKFTPVEKYDELYRTFNPRKFDAEEWVQLMHQWGARYFLPTGKHHDGFSMWFSRYSPYTIKQTPFGRDPMKDLGEACRRNGVVFGSYYSDLDWYHPDWKPYDPQPGPLFPRFADSPNLDRYLEYMRNQLLELIDDYKVEILQFDGEWPATWTHEIGSELYRSLRMRDPHILLSSRIDRERQEKRPYAHAFAGDFEEREVVVTELGSGSGARYGWSDRPAQQWETIDRRQWSWNPDPELRSADELIIDLVTAVGCNSNFLINVPARPDGTFDERETAIMNEVGAWLQKNGESIYGTRGGPFYPGDWGVSTQKGNQIFLHLWAAKAGAVNLPPFPRKIERARLLANGRAVRFAQSSIGVDLVCSTVSMQSPVTVVVLDID